MMDLWTIGIIGGGGWLGRAFAHGMIAASYIDAPRLILSGRSNKPRGTELPGTRWTTDNQQLVDASDVIVISVRPEQFPAVQIVARGKLVISFMAGVSVQTLQRHAQSDIVVRAMPNAAATVRASYTPWFATGEVTTEAKKCVQSLLETCGAADEVENESAIDYFTGLTGSGPAFPALLADAMIGHAISKGLNHALAERAVQTVMQGAGQLLAVGAARPEEVVRALSNYRGTTTAAFQAMIDGGFPHAVHAALDAAEARAVEMSRQTAALCTG